MCLITDLKEPFISDKNITTYKHFTKEGLTAHQHFKYVFDKLYETDFVFVPKQSDPWIFRITWNFLDGHDWRELSKFYPKDSAYDLMDNDTIICISEGFHSAFDEDRFLWSNEKKEIYECTVPAGATYYKDRSGLLVSNKIIVHNKDL